MYLDDELIKYIKKQLDIYKLNDNDTVALCYLEILAAKARSKKPIDSIYGYAYTIINRIVQNIISKSLSEAEGQGKDNEK